MTVSSPKVSRAARTKCSAAAFDAAFAGELAQHPLEFGAAVVLEPERARDFAHADLARPFADERKDFVLGWKHRLLVGMSGQ